MIQYGMVQYGMVQYGMVQYSMVWYSMVWHQGSSLVPQTCPPLLALLTDRLLIQIDQPPQTPPSFSFFFSLPLPLRVNAERST